MEKTSMTETKYGKYIISEGKPDNAFDSDIFKPLLYLDDTVLPGGLYVECAWYWEPSTKSPPAHTHEFDEVLGFIGTDPENPRDLCGEVEFWLGDERHIITKSCVVFVPRGLKHSPLNVLRTDRPIFNFATGSATGAYKR
jgi:mannose-6-phosphate isomerase-like protein (cupin superfamily)